MKKKPQETVHMEFDDSHLAQILYGTHNEFLKYVEARLKIKIHARGGEVSLQGSRKEVLLAEELLSQFYGLIQRGHELSNHDLEKGIHLLQSDPKSSIKDVFLDSLSLPFSQKKIYPKSQGQKLYLEAIKKNDIIFGVGPAGTGKTYLAMAMAVQAFLGGEVKRIILTRPAIEAGEKLGFLPGNLTEKVDPYLRPLYDALNDMLDFNKAQKLIERGDIEVAPLAFMRGRTLNDAFVILDEAQNCTVEQMKMFLTRIGFESKVVVTGDASQVDLPREKRSGLTHALKLLKDIEGIHQYYFTESDVVRHPLVQKIIRAYEND